MNNVADKRLRKLLVSIIITMTLAIASVFLVSSWLNRDLQQQTNEINANLIGYLSETYDLNENDVIAILTEQSTQYSEKGAEILEKYGMNDDEVVDHSFQNKITAAFAAIILVFTALVFLIVYFYLLRLDSSISNISKYINRLLNKDYALDIIDNDEGSLSALKNDIYKITVMLKEQNEVLKQDKMQLANNLADISHQLKTPLTSMLIMSDLLQKEDLSKADRKKFLEVIRSQLKRIEWLVSSLLKMAKLDAKTVEFKKEKIYADDLILKAVEPVNMLIKDKNQQFILCGDNPILEIDINWTSEALLNILKNCCEHTPVGGQLKAEIFDSVMYTEIVISDNGEGISSKDLPFIFERFYRASKSSDDSVGIGLAMSYSILTSQEASVHVRSRLNVGTAFSIRFYKQVK
ncbi:HAMP domain-containing sensor histidine kinase [Traorella massiliensis]|uniref:sensor histidine kinase n=1 Tax=Traorella massiliensis TaxID=1903263 RepID=UPI00248EF600|nr:HAMP domain-containing sensor histidine kinase [Traorella massiliensis]